MDAHLTPQHHGLIVNVDPLNEAVSLTHLGVSHPIPRAAWGTLARLAGVDLRNAVKDSGRQAFYWDAFKKTREQYVALSELLKIVGRQIYMPYFEFKELLGDLESDL